MPLWQNSKKWPTSNLGILTRMVNVLLGRITGTKSNVKASFTLSRCTPRCVPAVYSRRTGANRDESGRKSSAFIYSRQCYGPGPVWGTNWSRYVPVILRFATVHSRCRSGGATVCPGVSRYTSVLPRKPAAECFTVAYKYQWFCLEPYNRNVICKVQNSIYILKQKEQQCEWERRSIMALSTKLKRSIPTLV